jgi:hypothetical protein
MKKSLKVGASRKQKGVYSNYAEAMPSLLKAASPAVAYILLAPTVELAHIYTCRCELIFILTCAGIPEPSDKECQEGSHSLCVSEY